MKYEHIFKANNTLYERTYNEETKESSTNPVKFIPSYFIKTNKETEFKSILTNENLQECLPKTLKDYKNELNLYKSSSVVTYGNKSQEHSYIRKMWSKPTSSDHFFHTIFLDIETMVDKKDPNHNTLLDWKPSGSERSACAIITSIQMYDTKSKEFYIFGLAKEWKNDNNFESVHGKINYYKFETETILLKGFIKFINKRNPTLILGYNSFDYDFPYLTLRIIRVLDGRSDVFIKKNNDYIFNKDTLEGGYVKQLSPVGVISHKDVETNFGKADEFDWKGIFLEDFLVLFKKYTFTTLTSYSLDSVASYELGSNKINHDEFTDFGDFYTNHFNKFIEYGIQDVALLIELDNKLKLVDLAKTIAYICGVNLSDVRGTVKQWNTFMFNECANNNLILPLESQFEINDTTIFEHALSMNDLPKERKEMFSSLYNHVDEETNEFDYRGQKFVGGITRGTGKVHNWIYYLDFASLYPSAIQWANIGIDTLILPKNLNKELLDLRAKYAIYYPKSGDAKNMIEFDIQYIQNVINNKEISNEINTTLKKHNVSMTPNGMFFRNDKRSIMSLVAGNLISQRKVFKTELKGHNKKIKDLKEEKKKLLAELDGLMNEPF